MWRGGLQFQLLHPANRCLSVIEHHPSVLPSYSWPKRSASCIPDAMGKRESGTLRACPWVTVCDTLVSRSEERHRPVRGAAARGPFIRQGQSADSYTCEKCTSTPTITFPLCPKSGSVSFFTIRSSMIRESSTLFSQFASFSLFHSIKKKKKKKKQAKLFPRPLERFIPVMLC